MLGPHYPNAARGRWRRRLAWLGLPGGAVLILLYVWRAPLLTGLAQAWAVNDPVAHADAIVVLGGGLENRPFAAAKLYHDGVAPRILYMNVAPAPVQTLGIIPPEADQTRRLLLSNHVPETALTAIGNNVTSTFDEARAVRDWVEQNDAGLIIITTDLLHTRRSRWIFTKTLRGTKTEIHMIPVDPISYKVNDWWKHEEGVVAFQNELIKYLYYRIEY
jgi:uncharacterized SAM-binding protein YcdF (DUF218 family)